ncbi:MAG: glycoside hydrolase [Gemmatimonadaceae bacterium]|nr:glycoside hydrolase [Gemmatimonadaceae bacterium]
MHWRQIGPLRAGRARALSGVPTQPSVFYIGFDNGGVWRSTDYGSNWEPIFDQQATGSIGAIAVAPSDPRTIYVGSGAGIIRPDLAVGDGMYKSVDAGKTWTHLGLRESQMIAHIDVDPKDANRLFVAVLGHPYGPNTERGIFRSLDGGKSFQRVLYKDEYTSGNDVRIDPSNPNIVYATLWQQQQSFIEGQGFGGGGNGIFKSIDGGATWKPLTDGLPNILQANIALAPSNPRTLYAMAAGAATSGPPGASGPVGFYKSTDAGEHWQVVAHATEPGARGTPDPRPLARIGGGDLPTIVVDPTNEKVVYSSSTVFWRTEDAGLNWSAIRGAPGGDDYQKTWINPLNPDIILAVADQGGVVSANRGVSWSNWYNQPTAAMYHVSTDMNFPYRVCGGQQDSGSACVDSRSMDGRISFHDWHPVNIQEYGIAASDPKDPDKVFGSQRSGVSLYDRRTAQTTQVGPDMSEIGPKGERYNRNVRTMPILWSPVDNTTLYYASNAVWKSTDRAHSWTRISPDLTRQTWAVPATAGKYASSVTPGPMGAITALSASPRSLGIIWTGTDDGTIQTTMNGGTSWKNVTPGSIKPWTRIFNIEAGHFDSQTAYAAANTLRLDDLNPHFYRTHDGGATWTEINTGIAAGAVSNAIREDPRVKGLLYAATDLQVWVSFDDGDHWQSLKNDMPPISVRDIQVKDDSTCLCSDLIAATHGRGFWILDNVTPLRQAALALAAKNASKTYLFKPATAVRVRFGTNEPTPWPPELPAGENPLPGGVIDYYLAKDASAPVSLEILNSAGRVVRTYTSRDSVLNPHPALDPVAYDKVCQKTPSAPFCGLPLYWPAQPIVVSAKSGMHRFSWDLHLDPVDPLDLVPVGDDEAQGAVPRHTYPLVNAPWAPAGSYTVRLTVDGQRYTQPITLKLDPRLKTSAVGLAQLNSLSMEMYNGAVDAHQAFGQARGVMQQLEKLGGADVDALKAKLEPLSPSGSPQRARGRRRGPGGGAAQAPSLETVSNMLLAAAMGMQAADFAPTAVQIAACAAARKQAAAVMPEWSAARAGIAAFNAKRKAAGQPTVSMPD